MTPGHAAGSTALHDAATGDENTLAIRFVLRFAGISDALPIFLRQTQHRSLPGDRRAQEGRK
jgi:hypothetical protein